MSDDYNPFEPPETDEERHRRVGAEIRRNTNLKRCQERALAYLDSGKLLDVVSSMLSDLGKCDGLRPHSVIGMAGMLYANNGDTAGVRRWIEGFR